MKIPILRTIPGIAATFTVVAATSVGAYALTNWFGGKVHVMQKNASVLTVDLSSCQGNLPPGVDSATNRHDVQFKILGNPHISKVDLQQDLLGSCESSAVSQFYASKFPLTGASQSNYLLVPATVVANNGTTMTVKSTGAKAAAFGTRTLHIAADATVYNQGKVAAMSDLQAGDNVQVVVYSPSRTTSLEGTSIFDQQDAQLVSVFKTTYNDGTSSTLDYQQANIAPVQ